MKLTFFNFREYLLYVNKHTEWVDSITPSEAAELLGLSRQRVLQMVDSGEMDAAYILHETFVEKDTTTNHVYLKKQDVIFKSKQLVGKPSKAGNPTKFFHNRVQANPEKLMPEFKESLSGWLFSRTSHMHDFITSTFDLDTDVVDTTGTRNIKDLIEMLDKYRKEENIPEPMLVSVSGMFLQATLLSAGLWSNQYEPLALLSEAAPSDLQRWLIRGFSAWAPSFDFNPPISNYFVKDAPNNYPYLIGQLGVEDEAFSLPILISSDQKNIIEIIAEISLKKHAFPVKKLRGLLTHKTHLSLEERVLLGDNNDYCIKINTNEHILIPDSSGNNEQYSGYLWVCLGDIAAPSTPENSYFIWEHTDLSSKESIAYNLDSLEHKVEYIRGKNTDKNLVLLHKSMPVVNGDPVYSPEKFYDFLLNKNYFGKQ